MKRCSHCRNLLNENEFYKNKSTKDGLHGQCKKCLNACHKRYCETNPTQIKNYNKDYYASNKKEWPRKYGQKMKEYQKYFSKTIRGCLLKKFYALRDRCNNKNSKRYKDYGGRGIKCKFETSDSFLNYVINILKIDPRGLQIDRIDNDGHYEPGNIRFVTAKENCNNRRNNRNTVIQLS